MREQVLQTVELNAENEPVDKNFMGQVRAAETIKDLPKPVMKQVMPFASFVMKQVPDGCIEFLLHAKSWFCLLRVCRR